MKNILLPLVLTAGLFIGCSNEDDGPKCESCTSEAGTTFRICEGSNGTYKLTGDGESTTITEGEMEGLTPKLYVESVCALDREL